MDKTTISGDALALFQARMTELLLRLEAVERDNARLRAEKDALQEALDKATLDAETAHAEYATLRVARHVAATDGDIASARARIARMIKEIDRVIALINA